MHAVISDAKFFKGCLDAVANLVDEGSFEFSSSGMHLRSMDPSQIAMVDFLLPPDGFEKLDATDAATIGLNVVDVGKILSRARAGEKLVLSMVEKESKLSLEFAGESKRHFTIPLLEVGGSMPKEPKIAFDAHVKMRGGAFKEILGDAGLLSSHMVINAKDGEFVVEAHGDAGDLLSVTRKDASSVSEFTCTAPARAMYPFEYLQDMTKACPDDAMLELSLKSDAPVKIAYSVGKAQLSYYLAPRVETV